MEARLIEASQDGDAELVTELLECGADVMMGSRRFAVGVFEASRRRHGDTLKALLRPSKAAPSPLDLNSPNDVGEVPLFGLCTAADDDTLDEATALFPAMLQAGADPAYVDAERGVSALLLASGLRYGSAVKPNLVKSLLQDHRVRTTEYLAVSHRATGLTAEQLLRRAKRDDLGDLVVAAREEALRWEPRIGVTSIISRIGTRDHKKVKKSPFYNRARAKLPDPDESHRAKLADMLFQPRICLAEECALSAELGKLVCSFF